MKRPDPPRMYDGPTTDIVPSSSGRGQSSAYDMRRTSLRTP